MNRLGLSFLLWAGFAHAQVITTVAGSDAGVLLSGVSAVNAPLLATPCVAVDTSGNLYIADPGYHVVSRVTRDGTLTVIAGNGRAGFSGDGGPATSASLNAPNGIAVDPAGNLYIADLVNNRVRKVSGGIITTVAGNGNFGSSGDGGPATSASVGFPLSLAVDSASNLYIVDATSNRVRKVSGGIITTVAGNGSSGSSGDGGPATSASITPLGVAVDSAGNLYIADNGRIRKVSGGNITTVAGNGNGGSTGDGGPALGASIAPNAVAVDSSGVLYISEAFSNRIRKVSGSTIISIAGNGNPGFSGDGGPATSASLFNPSGVAVDPAGTVYIADAFNRRVRKVSAGVITTAAGNGGVSGDGGPATAAALLTPYGLAIDPSGSLYISDLGNRRIRKISAGKITTVAGNGADGFSGDGGPAVKAPLGGPENIAVDTSGNLYIADSVSGRIRKVSASGGIITTVAGNGRFEYAGDGGPATSASLAGPTGVAVDPSGNIYIADSSNNRVRKVSASTGIITTVAGNGTRGSSGDGGPATSASIGVTRVATDADGNVFIVDPYSSRIRKVSASNGIITTVAGNGTFGYSGDGGAATTASLNIPAGLAVDATGNVYIADSENRRVREVLAASTACQVGPMSLTFSAPAGGSVTGAKAINFSCTIPGLAFTASSNASWLAVTPSAGSAPATLQIIADPSSLSAGSYQGSITIAVPDALIPAASIPVSFTVTPGIPPALGVDTQRVSFTAARGDAPVSQSLQVLNTGGGSLNFAASAATSSGGQWLAISPTDGTATPSSPVSLTVTATPGSLPVGTYSGSITITGAGKSILIPVTLSLSAASATILLSQTALSFTTVASGGVPLPQTFGILNIGQGSMSWTASASTLSGGNWLEIAPSSGTVQRPYLDVSLVSVSIDPHTLPTGTYYGRIQISAPAANTPQSITVVLTVLPEGITIGPQLFPAGLIFTGVAGATPGSQDVQLNNPSGKPTTFISGAIGAALDYLPKSAAIQPDQPTTVRVYPDFSKLAPGTVQQGTITLQFSDLSTPQTISVLTVVAPADAPPAGLALQERAVTLQPRASSCTGAYVVFRSPQASQSIFAAIVGQASAIEVQIADSCGSPVGPNVQSASVIASFSNSDSVAMVHIGNGIWQGSWRPLKTGALTMFVTAFAVAKNSANLLGRSPTLTASVSAPTPTPTVTAQGVVHSASDLGGVPIAPGGLVTIYGDNLADAAGESSGPPLPQQLNGTQVLLGNQRLPILYTNPGQLNVQVPYGVPVDTQYQLTVQRGDTYSAPQPLVIAQAQPGIFTVNQAGTGQGSIVKSDGVTLAQPGTPAKIGETIVIYCTGLGRVSPAIQEGVAPPSQPLSRTVNDVIVTIGGRPATVSFSGLTPGSPGLYQVNAVVPDGIATGDAVPVVITVAGQTSPAVTIAVL